MGPENALQAADTPASTGDRRSVRAAALFGATCGAAVAALVCYGLVGLFALAWHGSAAAMLFTLLMVLAGVPALLWIGGKVMATYGVSNAYQLTAITPVCAFAATIVCAAPLPEDALLQGPVPVLLPALVGASMALSNGLYVGLGPARLVSAVLGGVAAVAASTGVNFAVATAAEHNRRVEEVQGALDKGYEVAVLPGKRWRAVELETFDMGRHVVITYENRAGQQAIVSSEMGEGYSLECGEDAAYRCEEQNGTPLFLPRESSLDRWNYPDESIYVLRVLDDGTQVEVSSAPDADPLSEAELCGVAADVHAATQQDYEAIAAEDPLID